MRTDTKVEGRPILAVWTSKAVQYTSSSVQSINSAVCTSGIGRTQEKRDFLRGGTTDTVIIRGVNNVRQSCIALYLDDRRWPNDLLTSVQAGKKYAQQKSLSVLCLVVGN